MPNGYPAASRKLTEIERASRLLQLGEMAAGLAHEINQPLAAIMYTLSGAVRRARGGELNNAQMLDVLQAAIAHTHRASEIVTRVRGPRHHPHGDARPRPAQARRRHRRRTGRAAGRRVDAISRD